MTKYLLDTNHISPLVTLGHKLRKRVWRRLRAGDTFAIAVPALAEALFGIGLTPRAAKNLVEWDRLKDNFAYLIIDRTDAEDAAHLQIMLRRRGWQLETVDALIATIALHDNLVLLTTDKDFTAVPRLKYENWLLDS